MQEIKLSRFSFNDEFQYISSRLPLAFLYIEKSDWEWYSKYVSFKQPEKWLKIFHQTAGYMCNHKYIYAYPLTWRNAEVELAFTKFCDDHVGSCMSGNFCLDSANDYREKIRQAFGGILGVNYSYNDTQEGFYTFDLTKSALEYITSDQVLSFYDYDLYCTSNLIIPNDPNANVNPDVDFGLVVLGENCD